MELEKFNEGTYSPNPPTPRKDSQMRILLLRNTNRTIYVLVSCIIHICMKLLMT